MKQYLSFLPISFVFVLLCSVSTSPLYIYEGMDSAIFKTIGLALTRGKLLYVDIFDHKGPLLFFIQALGQGIIPGRWGIFIVQIFGTAITFTFMYRLIGLFVDGWKQNVLMAIVALIEASILYDGNQCEEWMLISTSIAAYYTFHYFLHPSANNSYPIGLGLLIGTCFAVNFFIRPNDAVGFVGAQMLGLFLYLIYRKDYTMAIWSAFAFCGGLSIVSTPIFAYFSYHYALAEMYYGWIGFNLMYSEAEQSFLLALLSPVRISIIVVFTIASILLYRSSFKQILWAYIPMVTLATICLGARFYTHYFLGYIVLLIPFLALLFSHKIARIIEISIALGYVFWVGGIVIFTHSNPQSDVKHWLDYDFRLRLLTDNNNPSQHFFEACDQVIDAIPKEQRDSVWNYNLEWNHKNNHWQFAAFIHNKIIPANRIIFYKHYVCDSSLKDAEDIKLNHPKWLILSHECDYEFFEIKKADYEYIEQHYDLVKQADSTICNLMLYRLKEDSTTTASTTMPKGR